jgi:hypothetical protein
MPATSAVHTYTTTLEVNDNGDGSTFVAIAEVREIKGPERLVGVVKATNLNSPNATLEKLPGMIDPGKLTATLAFTKAQYNTLLGYIRVVKLWRISWPLAGAETTPSRVKGNGFIVKLGNTFADAEQNEVALCELEIELTGPLTFTLGS